MIKKIKKILDKLIFHYPDPRAIELKEEAMVARVVWEATCNEVVRVDNLPKSERVDGDHAKAWKAMDRAWSAWNLASRRYSGYLIYG